MENQIELTNFSSLDGSIQNVFGVKDILKPHISVIADPIINLADVPFSGGLGFGGKNAFIKRMNNLGYSSIAVPIANYIENPIAGITGNASTMFMKKQLDNLGYSNLVNPIIWFIDGYNQKTAMKRNMAKLAFKKRLDNM